MSGDREPWIAVKIGAVRHPKVLELPGDAARWGLVVMWCEAKKQRPSGVFRSEVVLRELLGRHAKYLEAYIAGGFIHRAPVECVEKRCGESFEDLPAPALAVHDWHAYQRESAVRQLAWRENHPEKTGADRTRSWRLRSAIFERDHYTCRYCGQTFERKALVAEHVIPVDREDSTDDLSNLVAACYSCNYRKGGRTPEEAGMVLLPCPTVTGDESPPVRDASRDVSPSRALSIVHSQPSQPEGGPGETDETPGWLRAWLAVKMRMPTARQQAVLDSYLVAFDVSGPERAERVILENPADPLGAIIADLGAFREERKGAAVEAEREAVARRKVERKGFRPGSVEYELAQQLYAKDGSR